MVHLEETIEVPAPLERAFDYVADFTNTAQWDPGIVRASQISGKGPGVGARYEVVAEFNGREFPLEYVTERYDRPRMLVVRGGNRRFESVDRVSFDPLSDGTRITYAADFRLAGLLRLAEPVLGGRFEKLAQHAVRGLAAALGAGAVA